MVFFCWKKIKKLNNYRKISILNHRAKKLCSGAEKKRWITKHASFPLFLWCAYCMMSFFSPLWCSWKVVPCLFYRPLKSLQFKTRRDMPQCPLWSQHDTADEQISCCGPWCCVWCSSEITLENQGESTPSFPSSPPPPTSGVVPSTSFTCKIKFFDLTLNAYGPGVLKAGPQHENNSLANPCELRSPHH